MDRLSSLVSVRGEPRRSLQFKRSNWNLHQTIKFPPNPLVLCKRNESDINLFFAGKGEINTNRSPVMILWASVVAKHVLKYSWAESLALGSALAGIYSQAKGVHLGILTSKTGSGDKTIPGHETVSLFGNEIQVHKVVIALGTAPITRALDKTGREIEPANVDSYIKTKFSKNYAYVYGLFSRLCSFYREKIEKDGREAYRLYEKFRPDVASGPSGWGAAGKLKLDIIEQLMQDAEAILPAEKLDSESTKVLTERVMSYLKLIGCSTTDGIFKNTCCNDKEKTFSRAQLKSVLQSMQLDAVIYEEKEEFSLL
eukprot:m.67317 g.67317  ORF g.67317 m.67317 type:complete len:312 (+) comp11879_c0_seq1:295-1230(+)